ncbi:methyl-accepting chemotaxis protein [Aquabacterium sp.]|uniref:methyl-accepting chemotaxis protein n=2 Tax=Aquabacterium TaxID=92793 RepID=UPI0035C73DF6
MLQLDHLPLGRKMSLLIGSALAGIVVLSVLFLTSEHHLILEERKTSVRQTVELAHGILAHQHQQAAQGRITEKEAQQRALQLLATLRYSGNEYFWVNDMHAHIVMHGAKPELVGKDMSGIRDPNGKQLFVAFVDTVKASGAGYVFYEWPRAGSDQPVPKVSYVKGFAPWGWIVGSGVYIDEVDATVLDRAMLMSVGTVVLGVALLGVGLVVSRSIRRQLGGEPALATELMQGLANGDLRVRIPLKADDRSSLLYAMAQMRDNLAAIVGRVRDSAESVATASTQIAHGNLDLSQRTEQQASALEETAASMEELSATVRQNAEGALTANQLAQDAASVAGRGGHIVGDVVHTMKEINASAGRIADIIGVIDGIAFQTNILALNAAVEAARAGEQGRGFAVVASEVRSLAGRCATAAKEIKSLIGESVERVAKGSELVDQAGTTMNEVVAAIGRLHHIVAEISQASGEQSQGVSQVDEAVNHMDQATQQNAALVEESAAAAESLKLQAQQLVEAVAVFQLSSERNALQG